MLYSIITKELLLSPLGELLVKVPEHNEQQSVRNGDLLRAPRAGFGAHLLRAPKAAPAR